MARGDGHDDDDRKAACPTQLIPQQRSYKPLPEDEWRELPTPHLPKRTYILWSVESSTDPDCEDWHWKSVGGQSLDSRTIRCIAHKHGEYGRCRQPAVQFTHMCRYHGGNLPQVKSAAKRRRVTHEVEQDIRKMREELRMGQGPLEERAPEAVLADVLALTRGDILAIRQSLVNVALADEAHLPSAQAILKQYGIALDRAARVAETLVKVKQADRSLDLSESQAALDRLAKVAELGKDPEYREAAVTVAARMRERLIALDQQADDLVNGSDPVIVGDQVGEAEAHEAGD